MKGVEFFRSKICTNDDETKRFNDFVKYVGEYGLEYEVFDMAMQRVKNSSVEYSRDELEDLLSTHAMDWDV